MYEMMKTLLYITMVLATAPLAGAFDVGDEVIATKDTPANFYEQFERTLKEGETITVAKHDYKTERVYFISTNSEGKQIALNVSAQRVESKTARGERLRAMDRVQKEHDMRADFPTFRAKTIEEWIAIRKSPEVNAERKVLWVFKVSSISEQIKEFSITTFYSGFLGGRYGEQPVVLILSGSGSPDKPVNKDDWIVVEGKFDHISKDGNLYIIGSSPKNLGYGFFDTAK